MAKKKKGNSAMIVKALNAGAFLFAIMVIISFFMRYFTAEALGGFVEGGSTGWELFEYEQADINTYIVFSLVFSIVAAAIAVLKFIKFPFFGTKLFSFIFMGIAVAMLVFSILIMVTISGWTVDAGFLGSGSIGVGAILNLVFSILTLCCSAGAFFFDK